jgi:hypothetical protein
MSDCLHCDINELVRKRLEGSDRPDVQLVASMIAESLADLIKSVEPESEQGKVMADAFACFGQAFLEKDDVAAGPHGAH